MSWHIAFIISDICSDICLQTLLFIKKANFYFSELAEELREKWEKYKFSIRPPGDREVDIWFYNLLLGIQVISLKTILTARFVELLQLVLAFTSDGCPRYCQNIEQIVLHQNLHLFPFLCSFSLFVCNLNKINLRGETYTSLNS